MVLKCKQSILLMSIFRRINHPPPSLLQEGLNTKEKLIFSVLKNLLSRPWLLTQIISPHNFSLETISNEKYFFYQVLTRLHSFFWASSLIKVCLINWLGIWKFLSVSKKFRNSPSTSPSEACDCLNAKDHVSHAGWRVHADTLSVRHLYLETRWIISRLNIILLIVLQLPWLSSGHCPVCRWLYSSTWL